MKIYNAHKNFHARVCMFTVQWLGEQGAYNFTSAHRKHNELSARTHARTRARTHSHTHTYIHTDTHTRREGGRGILEKKMFQSQL